MPRRRGIASVALLMLVLVACGGGPIIEGGEANVEDADDHVEALGAESTETTESTETMTMLTDVREAVVYIEAQGTFADGMGGEISNATITGTGFAIDSSGLILTNNHVVTGAAFLNVYVDGESTPRNARVVGVSECSDLAVVEVDGDVDLWLDFYSGDIEPGLDVFAAGFPLGDPEYALTSGVVARAPRPANTDWASVSSQIEHTARILTGNSGGPLLTREGEVVGVVYAGNRETDQQYAVGRDEVLKHLDALRRGDDIDALGLNGTAFASDQVSGIFVRSVASGSAAHQVGVEAGDLVLRLEGINLAEDGTMDSYCRVLRSHAPDDALTIQVYRPSSDEILEGTINVPNGELRIES